MDEIINYVMDTPGNTNPNVLRGMLENSGGGGDYKFVEVARQEEFEWTKEKGGDWTTNSNSFDVDTLEKNIYAIKMSPYIKDFTSVFIDGIHKRIGVDSSSDFLVEINDEDSYQSIRIAPFESTPEVESIILYKLVPANEEETIPEAPSSNEEETIPEAPSPSSSDSLLEP